MKKLVLTLIAFTAICSSATETLQTTSNLSAEDFEPQKTFHLVPVLGLGSANLKTSSNSGSAIVGTTTGALTEFGNGYFTFQTGVLINRMGTKTPGGNVEIDLTYLSVPLFAKFNLSGNAQKTVYLKGGVMPGLLALKQLKYSSTSYSTDEPFKSTDIPAVIALGGSIPLSTNAALVAELSYMQSLANIYNATDSTVRNVGVMLTAGVSIGL